MRKRSERRRREEKGEAEDDEEEEDEEKAEEEDEEDEEEQKEKEEEAENAGLRRGGWLRGSWRRGNRRRRTACAPLGHELRLPFDIAEDVPEQARIYFPEELNQRFRVLPSVRVEDGKAAEGKRPPPLEEDLLGSNSLAQMMQLLFEVARPKVGFVNVCAWLLLKHRF